MLLILFVSSVILIFWAYFGYPLSLKVLALFCSREVKRAGVLPSMTLIITAHNEQKRIRAKLENTLLIDYPREQLQILVASDGSTDSTNTIVSEYGQKGIELFEVCIRGGKENAQKEAVAISKGEIIAFSDVATVIPTDGLRKMAANFADPSIGCVSSVDRMLSNDGEHCSEGAYIRYEMWLRSLESRVNSLVGLSGCFFAARREVCADFSAEMQSDFRSVLNSMKLGLRGVSDPAVIAYYQDISDGKKEFDRKVRTVLRGLTVFFNNLEFLNPFQYGLFSYQYFCHKLLRWLVPLMLLVAFWTNLAIATTSLWLAVLFLAQCSFYAVTILSHMQITSPSQMLIKISTYFVMANVAIALAWFRFLLGQRMVMWVPSER